MPLLRFRMKPSAGSAQGTRVTKGTSNAKGGNERWNRSYSKLRLLGNETQGNGSGFWLRGTGDLARRRTGQLTSQPLPFIMQQFVCPHPAVEDAEAPALLTANVESCFSSFSVWHLGHSGVCAPRRIASNLCPQDSHRYSKIGMITPICGPLRDEPRQPLKQTLL
jgi:hypothetical protein